MNVFELAGTYRHLEAMVDSEADYHDDALLTAWMDIEGDLNTKIENIGFAIRNREAIHAGKVKAMEDLQKSAVSLDKEIKRLKQLAIDLMIGTQHKKAGGSYLTLSVVQNQPSVFIDSEADIPAEYLREIPAIPASTAPDKKRIAEDMKAGVIVQGARLVPSVRLSIK